MSPEIAGEVSGAVVALSGLFYLSRVFSGKITISRTGWVLWAFIGFALLTTYRSSGARESIWPAVFGFINPLFILVVGWRKGAWNRLEKTDIYCILTCSVAMVLWYQFLGDENNAQWALYLSIVADTIAAVPTLKLISKNPKLDRPTAWIMFAFGYLFAVFAVTDTRPSNYILPIYMFLLASTIAYPLIVYRWREKIPLREWV